MLILRGDVNLMYTVVASRRVYRIGPLDPSLLASLDAYEFSKGMIVSHEKVGTETVKGEVCDNYRFSGVNDSVENSGKIVNKSGNSLCDEVNG